MYIRVWFTLLVIDADLGQSRTQAAIYHQVTDLPAFEGVDFIGADLRCHYDPAHIDLIAYVGDGAVLAVRNHQEAVDPVGRYPVLEGKLVFGPERRRDTF